MRLIASIPVLLLLAACQREAPEVAATPAAVEPAPAAETPVDRPHVPAFASTGPVAEGSIPSKLCNLEGIGDQDFAAAPVQVVVGAPLVLRGWAGIESSQTVPASVVVRFEDNTDFTKAWQVTLPVTQKRDDVAKFNNAPSLNTGFESPADLSALAAGSYRLYLTYASEGKNYFCDNGRKVELTKN